jgi:hypothetical protein
MVIISFTTWFALIKPFLLTMFLIYLTLTAGLWTLDRISTLLTTLIYGDGPTRDTVQQMRRYALVLN